MKKAIKTLIVYFIYLLCIVLVGTVLYMLFSSILSSTAGQQMHIWDKSLFIKSFFYVLVCTPFLVCPFVICYKIRHKGGFLQTISYILICAINWLILFPFALKQANTFGYEKPGLVQRVNSSSYFRQANDQIYYFTKDIEQDSKEIPSIIINTKDSYSLQYKNISADKDFTLFTQAEPFNDVYSKNAFPNVFMFDFINFRSFIQKAISAHNKGLTFSLFFLSFALVICSLYGISHCFDWKMLNTALIIICFVLLLVLNSFYYSPAAASLIQKCNSITFFSRFEKICNDAPLVLCNLFLSFVFIITGIINSIRKRKKEY